MSEKEDPWSRRDNKDPLRIVDETVWLGTENLLRWLKAFLRLRFLSSKSFPPPAPRTPRPVPGSNPETRGGLGRLQHSQLRSGEKKNVFLFTWNLLLGSGPSLTELGTLTLCLCGFSAGACSIQKLRTPFLTAFWEKRWTERTELNRGQL